jgi:hypothetical protein
MARLAGIFSRRRLILAALVLLALVALAVASGLWTFRQGHVVPARLATNHDIAFDFSNPPCKPAERPAEDDGAALVRYLGTSGLWIEWRGRALLAAPYFTRQSVLDARLGDVRWDEAAIDAGLRGLPLERCGAVLAGHSHYDHIADLPPILERVPAARAWVNQSGANMLWAFTGLRGRVEPADHLAGDWIEPTDADGRALPFRLAPLQSEHAPHFVGYHYADHEVTERWESWEGRGLAEMREGAPLSWLIDLTNESGATVFRIFYQDAVSPEGAGLPPAEWIDAREVDLAVLCMPSYWLVEDYPEGVLEATRAGHALATHYEDFLQPPGSRLRFVSMLTNARAARFLDRVDAAAAAHATEGPDPVPCGPTGRAWTMPLPGEWLRFPIRRR